MPEANLTHSTQTSSLQAAHVHGWRTPVLLLILIFSSTWVALVLRGLEFGFTGDLLDYAFHYDRLGTFGGMRWLVTQHLQRHLIAGVVSAPLAYVFPGQSAPWFAFLFLMHFVNALLVFLLANTLLRGRYRWVSFAASLLFAFHVVQVPTLFDFPTGGHRTTALALALISLWLYTLYRRSNQRWRLELSFIIYALAILLYEQTVLFFLLHPLLALIEDVRAGSRRFGFRWWLRVAVDLAAFPLFVVGYLFLLRVLFPPSTHLTFSPAHILEQIGGGVALTMGPAQLLSMIGEAINARLVLVIVGAAVVVGVLVGLMRHALHRQGQRQKLDLLAITVIGLALTLVSILGVSPGQWLIVDHPRSVYAASVGIGMALAGGLAFVLNFVPASTVRIAVFTLVVGLFTASGFAEFFIQQDVSQGRASIRNRFYDAVQAALPSVDQDAPPYLLIYTDAHPSDDLWLYAQDNRFTLSFDWLYGTDNMPVDVIYANLDPALAPPDAVSGSRYNGQFIVTEPEGIYSPLKPYQAINPARLIIMSYDSQSGTARVVDELPDDVLATANILERVPLEWRTNSALLPVGTVP